MMEKKGQILIVDDDKVIRSLFKDILESEGYGTELVQDVSEAEKALSRKLFDILIVDVVLPQASGLVLLKIVRERALNIPVIIMADQPTLESVTEALREGAYDYITKPVTRETLLKTVERAFEKKRSIDENTRLHEKERNLSKQLDLKVRERTRELFTLYQASKAINAAPTLPEALKTVLRSILDLIPYEVGEIYLIEEKSGRSLAEKASPVSTLVNYYQPSKATEFQTPVDYTNYILENKRPLLISDTLPPSGVDFKREQDQVDTFVLRSYIGIPIFLKDEVLMGILALGSSKPGTFRSRHQSILSYMADHIVIAVQNAQFLEEIIQSKRLNTLGEMASVVAHEIRNPLLRIRLWIDQLRRGFHVEDLEYGLLDNILKEINGINSLVTDILDYAKPIKLDKVRLDIITILEEALADFVEDIQQKGIEVQKQYKIAEAGSGRAFLLELDGVRIKQVFVNLIKNAIEAMEQGGYLNLKVEAKYLTGDALPQLIQISCRDTGCGMTRDTLKRVFDPFFTTKQKGSGLGMAIVKRLVELHQGKIEVNSQEGVGTEFTIFLPSTL